MAGAGTQNEPAGGDTRPIERDRLENYAPRGDRSHCNSGKTASPTTDATVRQE